MRFFKEIFDNKGVWLFLLLAPFFIFDNRKPSGFAVLLTWVIAGLAVYSLVS